MARPLRIGQPNLSLLMRHINGVHTQRFNLPFSLANAQLAVRRVKLRVSLGGHDVPADVVRRRFGRSLNNFFALYIPLADEWTLFDNSTPPLARSVAARVDGQLTVTEPTTWRKLQKLSQQTA